MINRLSVKILLAVIVVAITAYYFFYPSVGFLPGMSCLLYATTGLYCPGCGGQRAFHALLHGDITTAAHNNLLLFIVLPLVALKLLEELTGKKVFPDVFYSRKFLLPLLLVVILFVVLRNIPTFQYLAPIKW